MCKLKMALSPSRDQLESIEKSEELNFSNDSTLTDDPNASSTSVTDGKIGKSKFNADKMKDHFANALSDDKKVTVAEFLHGFEELHLFLKTLGRAFGWIGADLGKKIKIIWQLVNGDNANDYKTVQDMVAFEVQQNLIKREARDSSNGTRNMLRLHRALEYVIEFLKGVPVLGIDEKCCDLSQVAYKNTLKKHHPWIVQKAALAAMHLLPTKKGLMEKFTGKKFESEDIKGAEDTITSVVTCMQDIHQIIKDVYETYELLSLP